MCPLPMGFKDLVERVRPASQLATCLALGESVLLPTDTVPAIASQPAAAASVWKLKRRPADKPLILMGADLTQLINTLGAPWRQEWICEAESCWPGAVTLVLPIAGNITDFLHPGGQSLGLRVCACDQARQLLRLSGPLATTSVNLSGHPPATNAMEAADLFPALSLLGPLPWASGSGQASEVKVWLPQGGWNVIRKGL